MLLIRYWSCEGQTYETSLCRPIACTSCCCLRLPHMKEMFKTKVALCLASHSFQRVCWAAQVSILRDHVNLMYYFRSPASPQASVPGHFSVNPT